ncbi:hypothetical protein [Candidatus Regiella insecticola]|uniref:hypothetical protein n=1 Tax=Candidatus Regiella insecticola TaxID=138073 RepID=UPI0015966A31|nr:hypothetical protein [Candidatus Regiella insecticola]
MFASGASVIFIFTLISRPELRPMLWQIALPVHVISFALAYILFSTFIGKVSFDKYSIDFFRGWGLDISFIAIPTRGIHWLPDWLGISVPRNAGMYFGDSSVWITTFSLPIILAGLLAWRLAKKQLKIATGILLVAIFGFYMALGPSLKINSTKPKSFGLQSKSMPAILAVVPTGNAWISEKLPGFNVMRASYRWSALGIFAFWLLVMIYMARTDKIGKTLWVFVLLSLIILNLPNLPRHWQHNIKTRIQFNQIDQDLVTVIRQQIKPGEIVAFLPWGNDFFANYLAPKAGFRTFNIGGDKNLQDAMTQWPAGMKALKKELDLKKASSALKMLIDGTADVLVVPYFDMLWAAHSWPTTIKKDIRFSPFFAALSNSSILSITDTDFLATIRLRPEFIGNENREKLTRTVLNKIDYPMILSPNLKYSTFVLVQGRHTLEAHHVWSQANAKLTLTIPKECDERQCFAVLKFGVYSANLQRAVTVNFESVGSHWNKKIVATSSSLQELIIPLSNQSGRQDISISIPNATSPKALANSSDPRILGIALRQIDLIFK